MVMAVFAKRLPVAPIPEQNGIAAVRDDMVNNCGGRQLADFSALHAERILFEEHRPGGAPSAVITAFRGVAAHAISTVFSVIFAVNAAVTEVRTAGISAWSLGFSRHMLTSQYQQTAMVIHRFARTQVLHRSVKRHN